MLLPLCRVCCLAAIGFLWLGAAGCGGGMPSTGETFKEDPRTTENKKSMMEEYKKKMAGPKGQAKKSG